MKPIHEDIRAKSYFDCFQHGYHVFQDRVWGLKCLRMCWKKEDDIYVMCNFYDVQTKKLYAFKKSDDVDNKIQDCAKNRHPIRICCQSEKKQKLDMGWGVFTGKKDSKRRHEIDLSDLIQEEFKEVEYPSIEKMEKELCFKREREGVKELMECKKLGRTVPSHVYKGYVYDSILETNHAKFFDSLGIKYTPHPCCIPFEGSHYTPDFEIVLNGSVFLVEIKPCFPYMREIEKCLSLHEQTGKHVVLFYGNVRLPFSENDKEKEGRKYTHSSGLRGILFKDKDLSKRKDVVWMCEGSDMFLGYPSHTKDLRWKEDILLKAYNLLLN